MEVFYVSKQGVQEGPHSLETISHKIEIGYLRGEDYIYRQAEKDWVFLKDFPATKELLLTFAGASKGERASESISIQGSVALADHWYLLRQGEHMGPFDFEELSKMLREGLAFEHDFIWQPSLTGWLRLAECESFQEKIRGASGSDAPHSRTQFRRRDQRHRHKGSLVLHNHKKLWNAEAFDLSVNGASVLLESTDLQSGEMVVVHYRPSPEVPAFNAHCEVMSLAEGVQKKIRVGLKFLSLENKLTTLIKEMAETKKGA